MATLLRNPCLPRQWLPPTHLRTSTLLRQQSTFAHLDTSMRRRALDPIFDDLTPTPSYRLNTTLSDFLPYSQPATSTHQPPPPPPHPTLAPLLPIPHHLLYFEPTKPAHLLLPDGTNPDQSPGEPFTRRMWAGGTVHYSPFNPLRLTGRRGVCAEFIRSVTPKGKEGSEKIFVAIERRMAEATAEETEACADAAREGDAGTEAWAKLKHRVRQRLWRDGEEDFGPCGVLERRNIVFMREDFGMRVGGSEQSEPRTLRPPHTDPDWTHSIVPDAKLLFRFSALTFNAHAIHLDPLYARELEGHRNLLFHGPLSYTFLVECLKRHLAAANKARRGGGDEEVGGAAVRKVEYRNLAPLYCGETVGFCGKEVGEGKWEVWATTPAGGVAVKGTVWLG